MDQDLAEALEHLGRAQDAVARALKSLENANRLIYAKKLLQPTLQERRSEAHGLIDPYENRLSFAQDGISSAAGYIANVLNRVE